MIRWPERYHPGRAPVHVANETVSPAPAEALWAWLVRAALWPTWYENSSGVEFPEGGDYESLGGFLTATAGRVPPAGSLVVWGGLTFTVKAADDRRVHKVEIARKPTGATAVGTAQHSVPEKAPPALQPSIPPDKVH